MRLKLHTWLTLARRLAGSLLAIGLYCGVVAFVVHWLDLELDKWQTESGLVNTIILGLLLGFRNRAAFDRWWEARRLWGQLTNETRNLAVKLAAFLPAEPLARSPFRSLLTRYPLVLRDRLRGTPIDPRTLPGVDDKSPTSHPPSLLVAQMYRTLAQWKREGLVDTELLLILDDHLRGLLDVCGGCERIRMTGISPSYKALLRLGIALNVLITPWYTMEKNGLWGIPVFLLVCFFLLGVEFVDTVVEEPFGTERDDLDLDQYCETIRASVESLLPAERSEPGDPGGNHP